ncbi:MAG: oligoendopeptidase F [Eubacteriales bacterium]|nr:oligoendopeptidase F [Eubacteriales bacterium]
MKRNEVPAEYKWKLEDICASPEEAVRRLAALDKPTKDLLAMRGTLKTDEAVLKALKFSDEISLELEEVYSYASFLQAGDNGDSAAQQLMQRVYSVIVAFSSAASFLVPELTRLPAAELKRMAADPRFEDFSVQLGEIIRQKKHILSDKEELLLSLTHDFSGKFSESFDMLTDVEFTFPKVRDEKGNRIQLTHARYRNLIESPDRAVRRGAFKAMFGTFAKYRSTLASLYTGSVKKDIFYAKARKYPSALVASLDDDNVDPAVYHKLIEAVHEAFPTLDDYCALRKKALGVGELHMYDLYAPLVKNCEMKYSPEEAKALVKKALAVMGPEYVSLLDRAYTEGWIDMFENEGKTSGAFCGSTYKVHPYVLLNFEGRLDDVFTMAHELGHAMHSYYSSAAQCHAKADYKIFVAEVASTVNEILLTKYLLSVTKDKAQRCVIINHYLEQFRTTVIRQTMFAEFEMLAHEAAEKGEPLNYESLNAIYYQLNKDYYGRAVKVDEAIAYEWSRIPHFYNAFYVYKYATGFSAASAIAADIWTNGEKAVARYKKFLSGGCSDYPIELLKKAGVDLSTNEPVRRCMSEFAEMVKLMKESL